MVRKIVRDAFLLSQKAAPATEKDLPVAQDLLDTLLAHREGCVGMAANMIGVNKRIIAFDNEGSYMLMFNPEIIKKIRPLRDGGGLPLPLRRPNRQALALHSRSLPERTASNPL